jgi:hypothetical protein
MDLCCFRLNTVARILLKISLFSFSLYSKKSWRTFFSEYLERCGCEVIKKEWFPIIQYTLQIQNTENYVDT